MGNHEQQPLKREAPIGASHSQDTREWTIYEHKLDHGISGDGPGLAEDERITVVPRSRLESVESELQGALDVIDQCARRDPPLWSDQAHKDAALALLARHGRQG